MLESRQVRTIIILGALFAVGVALILMVPQIFKARHHLYKVVTETPPPATDEAPAPPPSPFPPGAVILHGALQNVEDGTPLEEVENDPAYRKLVDSVLSLTDEGLSSSSEGEIPYGTYLQYATELRGRIFQVGGIPIAHGDENAVEVIRLPDPIQGREDTYRVILMGLEGRSAFVFDFVEKPSFIESKLDRIVVDGMFYKIVSFENNRGETREVPLFVARTFREMVMPSTSDSEYAGAIHLLRILLCVGILGTIVAAYILIRGLAKNRLQVQLPRRKSGLKNATKALRHEGKKS